jgi:TetR/AcrR family transcriptional repressor of nem operon
MKARRKPGPKPKAGIRDKLLDAGLQRIATEGYAASGISEIADAASVAKGSFYHYFDSKEAFGAAAADSYFQKHWVVLQNIFSDERREPIERLRAYFDGRIDAFRRAGFVRGCMLGNLGLEVSDHSSLIRERLDIHFQQWSDLFTRCIAEAQRRGSIVNTLPASTLGRHLVSSWEGAILRMRVEKSDQALLEFVDLTFNHLLACPRTARI